MSARALGIAVAALAAVLWTVGAIEPAHHGFLTSHDLRWYFFPLYEAFYGAVRAGSPTAWNPYQLCGMPFVGTLQAGFFYPFHVLYLALPTPWALAASTALHVALMAGAAAAFARRAGLSAPASILAAAVFAMTGMVRQWQFWPYFLEASAWIPVGAIGVLEVTEGRRSRGVSLLTLATAATCLAGCPQVTVFAGYTWSGLLIARLAAQGGPLEARLRAVGTAAAALVLGGMLAAVGLLPAYETSKESVRQMSTLDAAYLYPGRWHPGRGGDRRHLAGDGLARTRPRIPPGSVRRAGRPALAHRLGDGLRRAGASAGARTRDAGDSPLLPAAGPRVVSRSLPSPAHRRPLCGHSRRDRAGRVGAAGTRALGAGGGRRRAARRARAAGPRACRRPLRPCPIARTPSRGRRHSAPPTRPSRSVPATSARGRTARGFSPTRSRRSCRR
jgi:hypothetical protein